MSVLFIAHEVELGGATRSLLGLISELCKCNKVYVLISQKEGPLYAELKKLGENVVIMRRRFFFWSVPGSAKFIRFRCVALLYNKAVAFVVAHQLKDRNIRIVHSNSGIVDIGVDISHNLSCAHVWHIREFGKEDFNRMYIMPKWYVKKRFDSATVLICVSEALKNKYSQFVSNQEKVQVVYNGVADTKPTTYVKHDKLRFLIAGRVCEEKGQLYAIRAIQNLIQMGKNKVELIIAGEIEDDNIKTYVDANELDKYVTFIGQTENLDAYREKIDVELVCSKCEAFGRVTAEAMMKGHPVIGSASGGTIELIENGKDGFLYKSMDVKDLANKICIFYDQPELIKDMGEKARVKAQTMFTINKYLDNIEGIYRKVEQSV